MAADRARVISVNGVRHWTAADGTGPPVVLVHGGPGVCDYMGPVVPMLSDRWTVLRYEQRGCGRSEAVRPYAIATLAADLDALLDAWGHEGVALVGHSFGAALALYYAILHPERVERLVLWCGVGITFGWEPEHRANVEARLTADEMRRFDALREVLRAGAADPAVHEEWGRLLALADLADRRNAHLIPDPVFAYPTNFGANRELNADWKRVIAEEAIADRARGLAVPTLVWNAAGDPRPDGPARSLAAIMPRARFESLPGAGHLPWVERPDEVRDGLRAFLRAWGPRR